MMYKDDDIVVTLNYSESTYWFNKLKYMYVENDFVLGKDGDDLSSAINDFFSRILFEELQCIADARNEAIEEYERGEV